MGKTVESRVRETHFLTQVRSRDDWWIGFKQTVRAESALLSGYSCHMSSTCLCVPRAVLHRRRLLETNLLCLQYPSMDYLLKTEPTVYSFANLERDKATIWDGVTNPTAVKHLREMKPGERLVIYHTGDEKSAMGTASVVSVDASDPKVPLVKIKVGKAIAQPKTLAEIKARAGFADSPLVRQGRLSVVPLTAAQFAWLVGE